MRSRFFVTAAAIILVLARGVAWAVPMDIYLLIDESGSMEVAKPFSDPKGLRKDAAELYLDLSGKGDRISVIGFGAKIRSLNLTEVAAGGNLIRGTIRSIAGNQRYTDILGALKQAEWFLSNGGDKTHQSVIVLLTDGRITPVEDIPPSYDQTTYRSQVIEETRALGTSGVLLFTVALGPEADRDLLEEMSSLAGGQLYEAHSAEDLRNIYARLFVELQNRFSIAERNKPMPFTQHFNVSSALEDLTVLVFKDSTESEAKVTAHGPKGFTMEAAGGLQEIPGHKYYKSYVILKVPRPDPGDWTFDVQGTGKADVLVLQDFGYTLTLQSPEEKEYLAGAPIPVRALIAPAVPGAQVQGMTLEAELTKVGSDAKLSAPSLTATSGPAGMEFAGAINGLADPGAYQVIVRAKEPSGHTISEKQRQFTLRNQPVLYLLDPPEMQTYRPSDKVAVSAQIRPATPGETYSLQASIKGKSIVEPISLVASPRTSNTVPTFTGSFKTRNDTGFYWISIGGKGSQGAMFPTTERRFEVGFKPHVTIEKPINKQEFPIGKGIDMQIRSSDVVPGLYGGATFKGASGSLPEISFGQVQKDGTSGVVRTTFTTDTPGDFRIQGWVRLPLSQGGFTSYLSSTESSFSVTAPLELNLGATADPYQGSPIHIEYQFTWGARPVKNGIYKVFIKPPGEDTEQEVKTDGGTTTEGGWSGDFTDTQALGMYAVRVEAQNEDIVQGNKTVEKTVSVPILFSLEAPTASSGMVLDINHPSIHFTVHSGMPQGQEYKVVAQVASLARVLEGGGQDAVSQQLFQPTTQVVGTGPGDLDVPLVPPDLSLFSQADYKLALKVEFSGQVGSETHEGTHALDVSFQAIPPSSPLWIILLAALLGSLVLVLPKIFPRAFPTFAGMEVEHEGKVHDLGIIRTRKGLWFPRISVGGTSADVCLSDQISRSLMEIKAEFGGKYACIAGRGMKVSLRGGKLRPRGYARDGDAVKVGEFTFIFRKRKEG